MSSIRGIPKQIRRNELGIQMIPGYLRQILFGDLIRQTASIDKHDGQRLDRVKSHLEKHNLWKKSNTCKTKSNVRPDRKNWKTSSKKPQSEERIANEEDGPRFKMPDMEPTMFKMPPLSGSNVEQHFQSIGEKLSQDYRMIADRAITQQVPAIPQKWEFVPGWTKYWIDQEGNVIRTQSVPHPDEEFLCFDVEVCMNDSDARLPTLAVALGEQNWYSWCGDRLTLAAHMSSALKAQLPKDCDEQPHQLFVPNVKQLIPLGHQLGRSRLVVGHNVSFDRSFIREQYRLKQDGLRFLDTMSLHISVSGLTGYQRALCFSYRSAQKHGASEGEIRTKFDRAGHPDPSAWADSGSLNSLADVYEFHCGQQLDKSARDLFVSGSLNDIRDDFQNAVTYCAKDVLATWKVFERLWPQFKQRCPHPVTLAGMLEMSSMYLPVHLANWNRYLQQSQQTYDDLQSEQASSLRQIANESCKMIRSDKFQKDVWLWDLDWSTQDIRFRKTKETADQVDTRLDGNDDNKIKKQKFNKSGHFSTFLPLNQCAINLIENQNMDERELTSDLTDSEINFSEKFLFSSVLKKIINSHRDMKKVQPLLSGYPHWYREFCDHPFGASKQKKPSVMEEWHPGPFLISTQMRSVPKLLRLTWNGYVLHYDRKEGWGYLVPVDETLQNTLQNVSQSGFVDGFPIREYLRIRKQSQASKSDTDLSSELPSLNELENQIQGFELQEGREQCLNSRQSKSPRSISTERAGIPMLGCMFYRLPHKDGPENRVGNPLGKEFIRHMESGALKTFGNKNATQVLKLSKTLSYWKMSQKRIGSQMVCELEDDDRRFGALLPRVIVAGTITRRAVEPTWLTASNAYEDRAGSELKAMIQAPVGYKFVGADVDSQELWIASLLGDSNFAKIHGCTALGWMTLQGSKNDGTDMHSVVADLIGINRNEAKVLNYGRIYGAGKAFAARFLRQSNPKLSEKEAKQKAEKIYKQTKGNRRVLQTHTINNQPQKQLKHQIINNLNTSNVALMANNNDLPLQQEQRIWIGGSESHMFNQLEAIAMSAQPRTPVLNCLISTSLLNDEIRRNFLTSIVNWVVQSSAVDYLHLMLVSMRHLMDFYGIEGRFSISIHDEVRYLIREDHQHRAALALQVSNLLTRAMFASKLQMYDLPLSVAFFSSVDLDHVLRKEVNMDCRTPSNPHGLRKGYGIPFGESMDIYKLLKVPEIKELAQLSKEEKQFLGRELPENVSN